MMQFATNSTRTAHTSGFVMLEAVLALGLFATVATAMAIALNQLSSANTDMRREALLLRTLESAMTEAAHRTPLKPRFETAPTDAFGVRVETQIAPLNLNNQRGQQLRGLYQITVTATFDDGTDSPNPMQRSLEQTVLAEGSSQQVAAEEIPDKPTQQTAADVVKFPRNSDATSSTAARFHIFRYPDGTRDAEGITAISQGSREQSYRHLWIPVARTFDSEGVAAASCAPTRLASSQDATNGERIFPGYRIAQPRAIGWEASSFLLHADNIHSNSVAAR